MIFSSCFPGSTGTLAELSITLELINKDRVQRKRILCMGDYWKPVLGVIGNELRPFNPDEKVADVVDFVDSVVGSSILSAGSSRAFTHRYSRRDTGSKARLAT